jgi:hypothetical protein
MYMFELSETAKDAIQAYVNKRTAGAQQRLVTHIVEEIESIFELMSTSRNYNHYGFDGISDLDELARSYGFDDTELFVEEYDQVVADYQMRIIFESIVKKLSSSNIF